MVLLCIMVVLNHWISCFWFLVTKGGEAWVSSNGLDGLPWTEQYPVTFYTSLMMVMGDSIDVTNSSEHMLASLIVIIGVTMNATVFASIASYAAQISADAALHKNKMNSIRRSLMSLKLQRGLADVRPRPRRPCSPYQACRLPCPSLPPPLLLPSPPLLLSPLPLRPSPPPLSANPRHHHHPSLAADSLVLRVLLDASS